MEASKHDIDQQTDLVNELNSKVGCFLGLTSEGFKNTPKDHIDSVLIYLGKRTL
jgi:hypothetical protein